MLKKLLSLLSICKKIIKLEHISIEMSGDDVCRSLYDIHNSRHPRLKIIKRKKWGVALLKIPDSNESFLEGRDKHDIRTKLNKCTRLGFKFEIIDPYERIQEILDINKSMPERQGRPMLAAYVDHETLKEYFRIWPRIYGVVDGKGVLRAYACVRECGEAAVINRLLGHGDNLRDGIMYFLLIEVLKKQIMNKAAKGNPVWLMYDIFFTSAPGLQFFKERIGFKPYVVKWKWKEQQG